MSIRPRESERWQCSHGSGDPSGCRECKAEEREKKAREDELLNMIVRKPVVSDVAPGSRKSVDEDPAIKAIKERLEGKAGGKPSAAPARMESGPVSKNESLPPQETIGQVIDGIDGDALEALVNDLLKQPDGAGPLGEFARALKEAGNQPDQAPRPAVDASKMKDKPNAMRLLAQLGGRMSAPPQKRNTAAMVTRATMALSPASREEIKKVLAKRRRLSPKANLENKKTG